MSKYSCRQPVSFRRAETEIRSLKLMSPYTEVFDKKGFFIVKTCKKACSSTKYPQNHPSTTKNSHFYPCPLEKLKKNPARQFCHLPSPW